MRSFLLFSVFIIVSFSFTTDQPEQVPSNELIIPGEQAGPIRLGYTTIEEAQDSLGISAAIKDETFTGIQHESNKRCTKGIFYEYSLADSVKGIYLFARCSELHVVYEVRLAAPCKWKTAQGVGIGSSFDEIKSRLGNPRNEADTNQTTNNDDGYSAYHILWYNNIQFVSFHKMNERGGCCADEIILTTGEIHRPNAGPSYKASRRVKCPPPCTKC